MSETVLKEVFGVSEGYRVVSVEHEGELLRLPLDGLDSQLIGPECASPEVSRKGRRHRELQTVPIGLRPVGLRAGGPQCQCRDDPHRFEVPPFAPACRRLTHRLVAFGQTLAQGMCLSDVAPFTGLAWDTVKDLVKEPLEQDYGRPWLKGLRSLSIDEIYVGKTRKLYPLVSNLEEGRIVGVAPGKQGASRKPFWRALRQAKAKLKAVGGDRSRACWSAVAAPLPAAALGFERFHGVKRMNEQLDDRRRALWREARGLMKQRVKGARYLLLMRRDRRGQDQLPKLQAALDANEPLWKGYGIKEMRGLIGEPTSFQKMAAYLKEWCLLAAGSGVRQLQRLVKSVAVHAEGILAWWDHRISNGRMEGINHQVKTMLRQHYGLRDERFFSLRLLGLHEAKFKLSGC